LLWHITSKQKKVCKQVKLPVSAKQQMERGMNNPHIYTGPSGGGEGAPQQHVTAPPAKGLTFHYASVQSYAPSPATSSTGDLSTVSGA
jgi:hypothetical protein